MGPVRVGAVWMHMQIQAMKWDMTWGSCLTPVTLSICLIYTCNQQQIQVLMGLKHTVCRLVLFKKNLLSHV